VTLDESMKANREAIKVIKDGLALIDAQQRYIYFLTAACTVELIMVLFLACKVML
jgi:hypothetical protein